MHTIVIHPSQKPNKNFVKLIATNNVSQILNCQSKTESEPKDVEKVDMM